MPATVLFLECKSYVIVYTSISEFPLMCGGDVRLMCGDVRRVCGFQALPYIIRFRWYWYTI